MTKVGPARFDAGKKERREGASDPETTKSDKFDFPTSICSAPLLLLPRFRFDSETLSLSVSWEFHASRNKTDQLSGRIYDFTKLESSIELPRFAVTIR